MAVAVARLRERSNNGELEREREREAMTMRVAGDLKALSKQRWFDLVMVVVSGWVGTGHSGSIGSFVGGSGWFDQLVGGS